MNYERWVLEARRLVGKLGEKEFEYPIGTNEIRPPSENAASLQFANLDPIVASQVNSFYRSCDGFSWPDVWNGYFVKPKAALQPGMMETDPVKIVGHMERSIVVVGSSGGGDLFGLRLKASDIVVLPNGRIEDQVYYNNDERVRLVGHDFNQFLDRLLEDLEAFVVDDREHTYLI